MSKTSFQQCFQNLCLLVFLATACLVSVCEAGKPLLGDRQPSNTRRQIIEAIKPTIAIVGNDRAVVANGGGPDDVQEIEPELASDEATLAPLPDHVGPYDAPALQDPSTIYTGSIPSDVGDTGLDGTAFVGTIPIQPGTTPHE